MSTPDELVEVTPELLANLEEHLQARERKRIVPIDRLFLLALVRRIRELESAVEDCWEQNSHA